MQTFLTRRGRTTAVAASAAALLLTACSSGSTTADAPSPTPVVGLDAIYAQDLDWTDCGDLECADVVVPMDWNEPDGDTITIAINRRAATGERIGSLLVNPGGPGGSGVDFIADNLDYLGFGEQVMARYDLIGFDPRGVGQSSAVDCLTDAELDAEFAFTTTDDEAGYTESLARATTFSEACLQNTGPLLEHVGTVQAARDLDVLRAVLGDDTLHYLGYSYGTFLGTTYAALFPDMVGRMVLDGAVDPRTTPEENIKVQAAGFENALRAYVADCLTGTDCPLTGTVDEALTQLSSLLDAVEAQPLPTEIDDRELTGSLAYTGIGAALYSEESWPYLTMGLDSAITGGDGSVLLLLADMYYERDSNTGEYLSNQMEANVAINCADEGTRVMTYAEVEAQIVDIATVAPTMAESFVGPSCVGWPVAAEGGLDDYSAAGSAPILVVGTTNDPATPYSWSQGLTETLDSATLLTFQGEGHTAYGRSNSCILDAVDAYLIDGTVPAEGTTC